MIPSGDKKDQNEDKIANDVAGEKDKPNESNPMVIMARKLQLTESKLSQYDQLNAILLRKMTRMEIVMTVLTKRNPAVQTAPTTDALRRVDPKDPRTYNPHKDKRKRVIDETLKKDHSSKQQKKSKTVSQPSQKKKGNHASRQGNQTNFGGRATQNDKTNARDKKSTSQKDKHCCNDSNNQSDDVDEAYLVLDGNSRSLSTNDLRRRLNEKKEKARTEKDTPHGDNLTNHINDRVRKRDSSSDKTQRLERKDKELMKLTKKISRKQNGTVRLVEKVILGIDPQLEGPTGSVQETICGSKGFDLEVSSLTNVKQQPGESLKKYIQCMMDVAGKNKVTNDMKMVALTSRLAIKSLLWGDLQSKRVKTSNYFLTRAQGFINLEDAYAQAYEVLPAPSTNTETTKTSQMTVPLTYHPVTAFTTPTVYRPSASA
uniref:Uncharacterized protein n=1 Tax=Cannabis sativa TaxID=3483 RepID=A0A803QBZ4_CANSA